MKNKKEKWHDEVLECAVTIMKISENYSPKVVLPALVSCVQTTLTIFAEDSQQANSLICLIKQKLDQYEEDREKIVALFKNPSEGMEQ